MPRPRRIACVLIGALIGATAAALPAQASPEGKAIAQKFAAVTLITGDVVQLAPATGGKTAATVIPAPGREGITFKTLVVDGSLRVVPSDAIPLLDSGRVDAELFEVQRLVDEGYGDGSSATLPLIVQGATAAIRTAGKAAERNLPSIGATAVKAAKSGLADFWKSQTGPGTRAATDGHIWLDGKVKAALEQSTAQIGAPTAWQSGLDGKGVKVAVLDTGVDATHPDLAGRIAEQHNFSSSPDTVDHFGHGTHVASTIAGTGAASGGVEKGVAPGAQLLIGKVLGDDGTGDESSIIAGMQWAVADGAKVVSMSLGGDPTDGTDPMAAAVDKLTAQSGALFVIAAGNSGTGYSIGTPGSATSALTVGAVDSHDKLAGFSSRGPRLGNQALKPEITAPGVGIVAARAAGTTMGDPVDQYYTAASGTSMATPHVAGAAAILAGQHPGWTGQQIKNALISTARTSVGADVYGQGAGRVDVARAVTQSVDGTGVLDFGEHTAGGAKVTKKLTYTNGGGSAVTLTLGVPAMVTASASTVTVPAGGSADITVSYAPTGTAGKASGWISATGPGGVVVTTAVGAVLDGPKHTVTLRAVDRQGQPVPVPALTIFGDDSRDDVLAYLGTEASSFELQEGSYILDALIEDGGPLHEQATLVTLPDLKVTKDVSLVLDARQARPIRIETPRPAEQQTILSYYTHRVLGSGREVDAGTMHFSTVEQVNVTPTAKVSAGSFEFSSRWQLVEPMVQATVPGVAGPLDINLLGNSPAWNGVRDFPLAIWGAASVRGKAVLIPVTAANEEDRVAAAAQAGAAVALLVRPADWSAWTVWQPDATDRLPLVSAAVANDDGAKLLARAAKPDATIKLELTTSSPYLYDVLQISPDQVPNGIVYRVTAANSHIITSQYAHNGGFDWIREQRFGWRPWQQYAWNDTNRAVRTPSVREEWVSAGDSEWQHNVHHEYPWFDSSWPLQAGFTDGTHSYAPGRSAETWAGPVVRPASMGSTRTGNVLHLRVADFVDSSDKHYTIGEADQASATLTRNGTVLATLPDAWQDVTTTAGDATYQLRLTTARAGDDWLYGTKTDTTWSFKSGAEGALPVLKVDYTAPVDLTGLAPASAHVLKVVVPDAVTTKLEVSSNDGASWQTTVAGLIPAGTAPVSLRVTAQDKAGNSVTQTVLRAYGRG